MTEPLLAQLRYDMNPTFTTSEFKENALDYDIAADEAQKILSHMIDRGFIKRVKTGHYRKCERYYGEK